MVIPILIIYQNNIIYKRFFYNYSLIGNKTMRKVLINENIKINRKRRFRSKI